ncbi:MAG: hypothetical protein IKM20_00745 [Erysipelotrichales bacterium]|nr:hypothetical protein [Erysipelotrichales bacterium]
MEEMVIEVIYENMAGLKVYYLAEDKSYAAINGDEELEAKNFAVCFDDLLDILKTNTELPGGRLALSSLSKKREYYVKREMEKATTEPFQERFEVLFISSAERFGGLEDFYFVYDKKDQGYLIRTYHELMNKFENNESFDTLLEDIDAMIEDAKERDGIVKNLATSDTKHRQFEMGIKYLELLKNSK